MAGTRLAHILLSLWFFGVPWTVSWASQCPQKQEAVGEVVEGKALVGHVIKTLITPSIFTCGHKCALTTGCASYNYGVESAPPAIRNVCQLNSETHKTKPLSLKIKPGYLYVAAKVCKPGFIGFDYKTWTVKPPSCLVKTVKGNCCHLPFTYKGKKYTSCTLANNYIKPWCSLTANYNGKWGYCKVKPPYCLVRTVKGYCCHLPFTYKGKKYTSCTLANNHIKPWCSLTANYNRKWGYCKGAEGSSSGLPGKSCLQIRTQGHSRGNMKYWIDPLGEGNPFQVYCDMSVDGGGWTVIKEVNLTTTKPLTSEKVSNNYRDISEQPENQIIPAPSLLQLQKDMGFSQLRFYCYKKSVNRTFHIMTKNNSLGAAVVKYYTADPTTQPQACDSFTRLPDDSSILAQNCLKWGYKNGSTELNKWGHSGYSRSWRIYHHNAFWENHYYVGFCPSHGYWCDDNKYAALSVGDKFGLYVR